MEKLRPSQVDIFWNIFCNLYFSSIREGSREFVEGRLQNVACLIGIARNNRALAGVIGVPFPDGTTDLDVMIHYAVADQKESAGTYPTTTTDETKTDQQIYPGVTILTGDSTNQVLRNATATAMAISKDPRHIVLGGTAAKLVRVATEPDCLAILPFKTELSDTCATEALISSNGGKVTDLFGSSLVHGPNRPFGNIFGVVASSGSSKMTKLHDELCSKMRADPESVHQVFKKWLVKKTSAPQAMDIARDLDGIPFTVAEIQNQVLPNVDDNSASLISYSVPESGTWRGGLMSTGGRFLLDWKRNEGYDGNLPSSVFYKRIVMADLSHARDKLTSAPHKLIRDVRSYEVDTAFLTSRACQEGLIQETGLRINKVFGSDLRPFKACLDLKVLLESRFSVLLEDFSAADGWSHQWLLDEEAAKASLAAFAKMHAYFWTGSQFWKKDGGKVGDELERAVWPNGGYMQPALQGRDQFKDVSQGYASRLPTFKNELEKIPELQGANLESIGERIEQIAEILGEKAHPFYDTEGDHLQLQKFRTLIHGDPKQANIFFRRQKTGGLEVGLIDFQWCGFGLGATDVAHHICAALQPSCLSFDGEKEKELLSHYHYCLTKELINVGVATSIDDVEERVYPRRVLQLQYEIALLDICRMVFAYSWRRWKPETCPTVESLNRNAYNKSFPTNLWLITRCHVILNSLENEL